MSLWSPLDTDNIRNPFPMYRELLIESPVYKAQTGEWIISGYANVSSILKDKSFVAGNRQQWIKKGAEYLAGKNIDLSNIYQAISTFILQLNPPQHTQIRSFVSKVWNNKAVDDIIHTQVNRLIDDVKHKAAFDMVDDFSRKLPALVMSDILGLPNQDHEHLQQLGVKMAKSLDLYLSLKELVSIDQAAKDFITYFNHHIQHVKNNPNDGLLNKLVQLNDDHLGLNDDQLISIAIFLFVAGEETTSSLVSSGMLNLLQHHQFESLKEEPDNISKAVEELLRFDGPVHLLGRFCSKSTIMDGQTIAPGETVTLCLAGANRDPAYFDNPDVLDLKRNPRHIAFGSGIHYCLGDWLARKQGEIALKAIARNLPRITLSQQSHAWNKNLAIRSLASLPVVNKV